MTFRASALFASRLILPRTAKNSSARRSIFGAIICIGIGIIPLVVVMSFADGMINGMTERIVGLSSGELHAYIRRGSLGSTARDTLVSFCEEFRAVQGVQDCFILVEGDALAAGKTYRTGARLRAVEPDIFERNEQFRRFFRVQCGSLADFRSAERGAVLGEKVAGLLGVTAGDSFRVILTKQNAAGATVPVSASFTVSAVVSSGYQELDALWIFIPLEKGLSLIPAQSANVSILIDSTYPLSSDYGRIKSDLNRMLSGYGRVYVWREVNPAQFQNFSSTKVMLTFIMLLIVLVASVNISSALVMLVMERRKEIAILKSLGASPAGITISFLLAGVCCGTLGTLVGLPIGILCAVNINVIVFYIEKAVNLCAKVIFLLEGNSLSHFEGMQLLNPAYYLTEIPVSVPFENVFLIAGAVILLSLFVSVIPAVKAGREIPLETFRKV